jgi:hypothetical protein
MDQKHAIQAIQITVFFGANLVFFVVKGLLTFETVSRRKKPSLWNVPQQIFA